MLSCYVYDKTRNAKSTFDKITFVQVLWGLLICSKMLLFFNSFGTDSVTHNIVLSHGTLTIKYTQTNTV